MDFLREKNRIPETMTFVAKDFTAFGALVIPLGTPSTSLVSEFSGGTPAYVMVVDAQEGMPTPGDFAGVFAVKGNAVVFDQVAAKHTWRPPPVFDNTQKPFPLSPTCLYYCVVPNGDNRKPAFECIDLVWLRIRKH